MSGETKAFNDDEEAAKAFDEWRELFTKARNGYKITLAQRERVRVLSKKLGQWFKELE